MSHKQSTWARTLAVIFLFGMTVSQAIRCWRWLHHNFALYYPLLIQSGTLPITFLLFPAGFFLQRLTLVEEGIPLFGQGLFAALPLPGEWTNITPSVCTPLLAANLTKSC